MEQYVLLHLLHNTDEAAVLLQTLRHLRKTTNNVFIGNHGDFKCMHMSE